MSTLTKFLIITAAVALILYDIVAELLGGVKATISSVIQKASYQFPIIAFAGGLLAGHLWWRVSE